MNPTKLLYLEQLDLLNATARVQAVLHENGRDYVVLDQTCFYPQGGGQPYDQGKITSPNSVFEVREVRFVDGIVKHIGGCANGNFAANEEILCSVDPVRRMLHSRLHSAGHVVDMAVAEQGLSWKPGKGYHFPEGPYVEYAGSLEGINNEHLKKDIEASCNRAIANGLPTTLQFMDQEAMRRVCRFVPENLPKGKPGRVVLFGDFGVPCGGTHVANLSLLKQMVIRKIKQEKQTVRIGYDVTRN